jgi:sulfite reductase beta subunit-like hemoprotein
MKTIRIDILDPKAEKILKHLADLNLIAIHDNSKIGFTNVLKRLRAKSKTVPTFDEITKEVEWVRAKRYVKQG